MKDKFGEKNDVHSLKQTINKLSNENKKLRKANDKLRDCVMNLINKLCEIQDESKRRKISIIKLYLISKELLNELESKKENHQHSNIIINENKIHLANIYVLFSNVS